LPFALDCSWRAAFIASALTHPVVWFAFFHRSVRLSYGEKVVTAQLFAWLAEAAYFRFMLGKRKALLWALIASAASVTLGLVSRAVFGGP
jgi:hypothetical protein